MSILRNRLQRSIHCLSQEVPAIFTPIRSRDEFHPVTRAFPFRPDHHAHHSNTTYLMYDLFMYIISSAFSYVLARAVLPFASEDALLLLVEGTYESVSPVGCVQNIRLSFFNSAQPTLFHPWCASWYWVFFYPTSGRDFRTDILPRNEFVTCTRL